MLTSAHCLTVLGNPIEERDMAVWAIPADLQIGVIPHKLYCNKRMVKPLSLAFADLIKTGCVSDLKTWDGCFNIRQKRANATPSLHSWGLAIDVNAAWNQFGKPPNLRPRFVKCFTDAGFDWGGAWETPDGMHFQLQDIE